MPHDNALRDELGDVLDAVIELQAADQGSIQLYDPGHRFLEIAAQRGFAPEFLVHLARWERDAASCARAREPDARVVIEDVELEAGFAADRSMAARAGFRAMQSTPLRGRNGETFGVISTHFRQPHRSSEAQLRFTDLYARHASGMIERNRVECALQRSEAYLAEGQRISHTGSWVWNPEAGVIFWSPEHFRIFGLDPATQRPSYRMLKEMIHSADRARVEERFDDSVRRQASFEDEYRIVRPDGGVRHIVSIAHPAFDGELRLAEYVGTVVDITERKRAEHALALAREELAHVARVTSMGELTASIAHEVNQPLASIGANANACVHWLCAQPPDVDEGVAAARRIVRDATRASGVIARIRAFLTRGEPRKSPLAIEAVIADVVSLAQGEACAKGVGIEVDAPRPQPVIVGDRVQLQQVLLNLVMNAIDALAAAPGRERRITIGALARGDGEVCVTVRDTGPGVDPEIVERIFDMFYTTKAHGMGMGLAISRSIIEEHGGRLWATRDDGPGGTFMFTLPIDTAGAP